MVETIQGVTIRPSLTTVETIKAACSGETSVFLLNPEAISASPKSLSGTATVLAATGRSKGIGRSKRKRFA